MTGLLLTAFSTALALAIGVVLQSGPDRRVLCASVDQPPAEAARALEPLGEAGRLGLLQLARSTAAADVTCGVAGLAALRDRRVVEPMRTALATPALRADAYRVARWAAFVAGGPESDLGTVVRPLVEALADPAVWAAAGDDAIRLLGEADDPVARNRLLIELARPQPDASLDAVIHALARQGEPRARERVSALGQQAIAARSGNLTYEQASRIGVVTTYLLTLGPGTFSEGLQGLRQLTPRDQEDAAAWAMQTWCERATRRPAERESAQRARAALGAELEKMDVRWSHLRRGVFMCPPAH